MNFAVPFLILAVLCALWNVVMSIMIYHDLHRRGVKPSFLWLRVMAPIYAHRYRRITLEETGHAGPLYMPWVVSINLAALFAIVALVIHLAYR